MFEKIEWTEERRREETSGTNMVGLLILFLLCVGGALLIAWPVKVASVAMVLCGLTTTLGALYDRDMDWGSRVIFGLFGPAVVYLGVRLVIYAWTGAW